MRLHVEVHQAKYTKAFFLAYFVGEKCIGHSLLQRTFKRRKTAQAFADALRRCHG